VSFVATLTGAEESVSSSAGEVLFRRFLVKD